MNRSPVSVGSVVRSILPAVSVLALAFVSGVAPANAAVATLQFARVGNDLLLGCQTVLSGPDASYWEKTVYRVGGNGSSVSDLPATCGWYYGPGTFSTDTDNETGPFYDLPSGNYFCKATAKGMRQVSMFSWTD